MMLIVGGIVLVAGIVRFLFINQVSGDYRTFLSPWYDQLSSGGFAALSGDFSNYNPPYLYLLLVATHLPISKIVAIKLISMVFDVLLAAFAALIVRELVAGDSLALSHRFSRRAAPVVCFAAVLFAPTVVVNSSWWGQCDSIYAACCLGSLFFLLRAKPWWACFFFGLALSFKLQGIFFLPVLIIVLVVNRPRSQSLWRSMAALSTVPAVFLVLLLPAFLAGRDLSSLLSVYPDQITTGGTGGAANAGGAGNQIAAGGPRAGVGNAGGVVGNAGVAGTGGGGRGGGGNAGGLGQAAVSNRLTQNAATFYQWLGSNASTWWKYVGFAVAAAVGLFVSCLALLRRRALTATEMVVLATTVVVAVPFFLPQMHERYFYLADVFTIVAAFCVRRFWMVAVVQSACSLLCYAPFLWNRTIVPLPLVALAQFVVVIMTLVVCWRVLRRETPLRGEQDAPGHQPRRLVTAAGADTQTTAPDGSFRWGDPPTVAHRTG